MGGSFIPYMYSWVWRKDDSATAPSAWTGYGENTRLDRIPLSGQALRLRLQVYEAGGKSGSNLDIQLQYSTDQVNWYNIGAQGGTSAPWRWRNGMATEHATLATALVTGTSEYGLFHEAACSSSEDISAYAQHEMDFCIEQYGTLTSQDIYYFRLVLEGTALSPYSGTYPAVKVGPDVISQTISGNAMSTPGWNFLSGWQYRQKHVINPATGAGSGYCVLIKLMFGSGTSSGNTIYLGGKSRSDFADVRFTKYDGSTLLYHFLCFVTSGTSAYAWVKVADDLGTQSQVIYVNYGKSNATDESSPSNVFPNFTDFPDASLPSGWSDLSTEYGTRTVENSVLKLVGDAGSGYDAKERSVNGWSITSGYAAVFGITYFQTSSVASGHQCGLGILNYGWWLDSNACNVPTSGLHAITYGAGSKYYDLWTASGVHCSYSNGYPVGEGLFIFPGIVQVARTGSRSLTYNSDTIDENTTDHPTSSSCPLWLGVFQDTPGSGTNAEEIWCDWAATRPYVYPEPAHSTWGTEEENPVGTFDETIYSNARGKKELSSTIDGTAKGLYTNLQTINGAARGRKEMSQTINSNAVSVGVTFDDISGSARGVKGYESTINGTARGKKTSSHTISSSAVAEGVANFNLFDDVILSEIRAAQSHALTTAAAATNINNNYLLYGGTITSWYDCNSLTVPAEEHEEYFIQVMIVPTEEKTDMPTLIAGRIKVYKDGVYTYYPAQDRDKTPHVLFATNHHLEHSAEMYFVIPADVSGGTVTLQLQVVYHTTRTLWIQTWMSGYGSEAHTHAGIPTSYPSYEGGESEPGNPTEETHAQIITANDSVLYKITADQTGLLTTVNIYGNSNENPAYGKAVVYSDASGDPGNLLGVGEPILFAGAEAWNELTGLSIPVTAGTSYWIGYVADQETTVYCATTGGNSNVGTNYYEEPYSSIQTSTDYTWDLSFTAIIIGSELPEITPPANIILDFADWEVEPWPTTAYISLSELVKGWMIPTKIIQNILYPGHSWIIWPWLIQSLDTIPSWVITGNWWEIQTVSEHIKSWIIPGGTGDNRVILTIPSLLKQWSANWFTLTVEELTQIELIWAINSIVDVPSWILDTPTIIQLLTIRKQIELAWALDSTDTVISWIAATLIPQEIEMIAQVELYWARDSMDAFPSWILDTPTRIQSIAIRKQIELAWATNSQDLYVKAWRTAMETARSVGISTAWSGNWFNITMGELVGTWGSTAVLLHERFEATTGWSTYTGCALTAVSSTPTQVEGTYCMKNTQSSVAANADWGVYKTISSTNFSGMTKFQAYLYFSYITYINVSRIRFTDSTGKCSYKSFTPVAGAWMFLDYAKTDFTDDSGFDWTTIVEVAVQCRSTSTRTSRYSAFDYMIAY